MKEFMTVSRSNSVSVSLVLAHLDALSINFLLGFADRFQLDVLEAGPEMF